ncbi:MAG: LysR family transcriptional regulator [Eggerthellaceae bacterium]|nr:LysR family transcriptional regulator [Eggerthellaceae bacterium]
MEIRWLEEYLELADSLNFTEAASKLHVTQPTLSKHLAALEQELGVQLIDRSPGKVSLTEEGVYFTGVCETILGQLSQAIMNFALIKSRRPLRISGRLEDLVVSGLLSAVSAAMIDRGYSPLVINQDAEVSNFIKLDNGTIDILLDILPPNEKRSGRYAFRKLMERPFVAVVDARNPLAAQESLSIQDLKDQTLIKLSWPAVNVGWQTIADLCKESGFIPNTRSVAVRSLPEALAIQLNNDILLYPGGSELSFLNPAKRKIIPMHDTRAHFDINLIYLKESEGDLEEFLKVFEETLEAFKRREILLSEFGRRLS